MKAGVVAGWVAGMLAVTGAYGAETDRTRLTDYMCASCHGPGGNSASAAFPRLAGQHAAYIEQQLGAFREGRRDDPPAKAYMYGISTQLTADMVRDLAKFYASQPPMSGKGGDPAALAQGKAIYDEGLPDKGVPACALCHGAGAEGKSYYPRLAGQYPEYLLKQMLFFQSGTRTNAPIMHAVSGQMSFQQMQAVVNYAASRP